MFGIIFITHPIIALLEREHVRFVRHAHQWCVLRANDALDCCIRTPGIAGVPLTYTLQWPEITTPLGSIIGQSRLPSRITHVIVMYKLSVRWWFLFSTANICSASMGLRWAYEIISSNVELTKVISRNLTQHTKHTFHHLVIKSVFSFKNICSYVILVFLDL